MSNDTNDKIEQIVNDAMTRQAKGNKSGSSCSMYKSIEEYTQATGKRFRMTADQKARNLTRIEAFSEFDGISSNA